MRLPTIPEFTLDFMDLLFRALNGGLSFGDGTNSDNLRGQWATVTTPATPGTEFAVPHTLGVVPTGFLLLCPPESGYVNRGATAWTTQNVYLTCSAATQTITLFLLAP
jgi:hypothetical protein